MQQSRHLILINMILLNIIVIHVWANTMF
jgi:hypothetical protein